jgi:hypothetical protein
MSKIKRELNPSVSKGDRVMCLHMDGETSVPPMTLGTVIRTAIDPFESDSKIIAVDWDNGSNLSLLSATDSWVKDTTTPITEQNEYAFFGNNPEIFENFNWRFFRDYLLKVKKSSVINMLQSAPFLYSGREWIDRYYGENQEDNESFQEVLEMAEESKNELITGIIKYLESNDIDIDFDDMGRFNQYVRKFSNKLLLLYVNFT